MQRNEPHPQLGKMPFHDMLMHHSWAHDFQGGNRGGLGKD